MTRDELESAIWQHLTDYHHKHITQAELVDAVLRAADAYATGEAIP